MGTDMFHVLLYKPGSGCGLYHQTVCADSLGEAEQAALHLLADHYPGMQIVLVHIGALLYEAYEVEAPLAQVQIKTV